MYGDLLDRGARVRERKVLTVGPALDQIPVVGAAGLAGLAGRCRGDSYFPISHVEDLSEGGGPFLGVDNCNFLAPVYTGETLTAKSTVMARRESKGNAAMGIVTWHTEGFNERGTLVIEFDRTNLVRRRSK